jgi:hypothetical protein
MTDVTTLRAVYFQSAPCPENLAQSFSSIGDPFSKTGRQDDSSSELFLRDKRRDHKKTLVITETAFLSVDF